MDTKGQEGNPRDRPGARERLARFMTDWGADLLMTFGGVLIAAGAGLVYPPAGLITAGALLIAGGVLWAKGGGNP